MIFKGQLSRSNRKPGVPGFAGVDTHNPDPTIKEDNPDLPPSSSSHLRPTPRPRTIYQTKETGLATDSVQLHVEGTTETTSNLYQETSSNNAQVSAFPEKSFPPPEHSEEHLEESKTEDKRAGTYCIEATNYLARQGVSFKPPNPFHHKFITVYASYPLGKDEDKQDCTKSEQTFHVQDSQLSRPTTSQHSYVVLQDPSQNQSKKGLNSDVVYLKVNPGSSNTTLPVELSQNESKQETGGGKSAQPHIENKTSTNKTASLTTNNMSNLAGMDIYAPVSMATLSRTQERAELQQLNDRFSSYVHHVRQLAERNSQVDSSAIIKSTKAMEVEIHNLKNMYEQELDKLRREMESCNHEKTSHQVHLNKQLQYSAEIQDRLSVETDKNSKLLDEVNNYQRRVGSLEAEVQDLRIAATRPRSDLEQLQRNIDNMTREMETWKHRYEHEQIARQEAENKIQQLVQKYDFNDKVNSERVGELNNRIESSAATILSLEAKVRDLSKTDVSVSELLKQVRDTAEAELRKFQIESEEQYNRNLTALKAQLDCEAKAVVRLEAERTQLRGSVGELQARIRSLEGQVANLEHQKQTLEDAIAMERNKAAEGIHSLERKLREVQDMLVVKMREVTTAREHNIPLKAEIEALKALLEDEEKRLRVPLGVTASADPTSFISSYNITTTATAPNPIATAPATLAFTTQPPPATTSTLPVQPTTVFSTPAPPLAPSPPAIPPPVSASHNVVSFASDTRSAPSPPLCVNYIPEQLHTVGPTSTAYDGFFSAPPYDAELDAQVHAFTGSIPLAKYSYETTPGLTRLAVEPSPPVSPRQVIRAKSAPVERQRNMAMTSGELGQGHDYFDKMFYDLQQDSLQSRPKSTPMRTDRPLSSLYHDYTVSTSSATGDMKIFEVHQEGKYVRLLNDGVQEIEFGGYMLQQNVGGHPVAVYRFAPRTKFAPNSTITVYAGCNDHKLHNPPQDFVWKEQQKWGTGPECTTILCRPNGQAVAWTTAAHRFTRDAFQDVPSDGEDDATRVDEDKHSEMRDDESLTEISVNVNGPKPEPVYLRREKQQPPSLQANKHPHGNTNAIPIHPHSGQSRPYYYGNDNSSNNRQSRSQSTRPDPVPGQPYAGASAQKMGSAPLRKFVTGVSTQPSAGIRVSGKSAGGLGCHPPSPFHSPLQQELQQTYRLGSGGSSRDGAVVRFTA